MTDKHCLVERLTEIEKALRQSSDWDMLSDRCLDVARLTLDNPGGTDVDIVEAFIHFLECRYLPFVEKIRMRAEELRAKTLECQCRETILSRELDEFQRARARLSENRDALWQEEEALRHGATLQELDKVKIERDKLEGEVKTLRDLCRALEDKNCALVKQLNDQEKRGSSIATHMGDKSWDILRPSPAPTAPFRGALGMFRINGRDFP